ncbi:coil containing protein [Vibrio phage 1.029.O._10N.261.55.A7]|nr:coil containing protein [Vibrio phage 1.029.O._10N.261.55.A7]
MKLTIKDKVSTPFGSRRVITDEGFLRVPAKAARTGIQEYLASELGLKDRNPMDVVNVYRPPEEVFDSESLASYKDTDVTDDHPSDLVNSKTYDAVSVGHVTSEGRKEGEWVVADLIIKSQDAIDKINSGKAEISMGYTMNLEAKDGVDPVSGKNYEFVQKSIKINHAALCDAARAGKEARLFDNKAKGAQMKVTLLDGQSVTLSDENQAALIQSQFDTLHTRLKDAEKKADDMEEEKEKAETAKDMANEEKEKLEDELEEEKKKTSDSAIADLVSRVAKTMDSAKKIAGKDFACDSMNDTEIKRSALSDAYPKKDWKDLSDAVINYAFDEAKEKKAEDEDEKEKATDSFNSLGNDANNLSIEDSNSARVSARDSYLETRYGKKDK